MKRIFILTLILASTVYCTTKQTEASTTELMVTIDPSKTYQTVEGWGSSLCWWAGQVGAWDQTKVNTIIDLFTNPDKLNMNIFRYNIGGGDDPARVGRSSGKSASGRYSGGG